MRWATPGGLFFVVFAVLSSRGRFLAIFLSERGLANWQVGTLLGLKPLIGLLSVPVVTAAADRLRQHDKVLLVSVMSTALVFFLYGLPEVVFLPGQWPFVVAIGTTVLLAITSSHTIPLVNGVALMNLGTRRADFGRARLFGAVSWALGSVVMGVALDWWGTDAMFWSSLITSVAFCLIFYKCCGARAGSLEPAPRALPERNETRVGGSDPGGAVSMREESIELQTLPNDEEGHEHAEAALPKEEQGPEHEERAFLKDERRHDDHEERVNVLGPNPENIEGQSRNSASIGPGVAVLCGEEALLDASTTKSEGDEGEDPPCSGDEHETHDTSRAAVLSSLCRCDVVSLSFLLCVIASGFGTAQVENLVFLFFKQDLGSSNILCGVSVLVTVVFEIPIFHFAPKLLKLMGPNLLLVIGQLAFAVRVALYTVMPSPGWVLLVEPLHGVTFGFVHLAQVHIVSGLVPPELQTSAQGLLHIFSKGGVCLGTWVGGFVMQRYGSKVMYRGSSLLLLGVTVIYIIAWYAASSHARCPCRKKRDDSFRAASVKHLLQG